MPLPDRIKNKTLPQQPQARTTPVWKGPEEDGITQSLLCKFLSCRERFRLLVVEGLKVKEGFNHRLEYGNMWHLCEEALAGGNDWRAPLQRYCQRLCKENPLQQKEIDKWYRVCKGQFPVYVEYWEEHQDVVNREPLLQEVSFRVPYRLLSGRTVVLRGKWDAVDLIRDGKRTGIYLQENKTKGDIDPIQMQRQLTYDLQTMIYLTALQCWLPGTTPYEPKLLSGVRYNVIRRPLSGGRHSIKQTERETESQYYERLEGHIQSEPEFFFMRWKVEITPEDIARFRQRTLDPLLENLCDWWDYVKGLVPFLWDRVNNRIHWQHPFGVYNPLDEGKSSDLDEYILSGSEIGLTRTDNLFPELT